MCLFGALIATVKRILELKAVLIYKTIDVSADCLH